MTDGIDLAGVRRARAWALSGKSRMYGHTGTYGLIDLYFWTKRVYRRAQRVPVVGAVMTPVVRRLRLAMASRRR